MSRKMIDSFKKSMAIDLLVGKKLKKKLMTLVEDVLSQELGKRREDRDTDRIEALYELCAERGALHSVFLPAYERIEKQGTEDDRYWQRVEKRMEKDAAP